jgi:outer membrane protein insertion porin family
MRKHIFAAVFAVLVLATAPGVSAQAPAPGQPGQAAQVPVPKQPPQDSPPLLRFIRLQFPTQGDASVIEPQTYLYYIQTRPSRPSEGVWVPYDEKSVLDDFKRLWATNFLDNVWIEVKDTPYDNGVMGKEVIFNLEERQRVKIVDYEGSKVLEQSKIEEKLRDESVQIRLDSFIDEGLIRRVEGIIRGMFGEKGYEFASVSHSIREVAGGPKTVHLTFNLNEGPKVRIRSIEFVGNDAAGDRTLRRKMKSNKQEWWLPLSGHGTYQAVKFEEDADAVVEHYRNKGYVTARVGQPEMKYIEDSKDGRTRYIELKVPVTEGEKFKVGEFNFDGNTVVKTEGLRSLFKLKTGEVYSEKRVRKALEKAREVYGTLGYFEFTAYPDLKPREVGDEEPLMASKVEPTVDVTMRVQEGKQYFINRVTFTGNTTTRDNVIRREVRLFEGGVFNTEALKYSIKRLNQLGYFKQLEGTKDLNVDKTPGVDNKVDIKLKLEEQNRNQLTFGAGVSQYEGFFGQLMFQTSNFMGRGETVSVSAQVGSRAKNYQLAFSEPFLFDRPITVGGDIHKTQVRYPYAYTQNATGGALSFGFQVRSFSRLFLSYSYEQIQIQDINEAYFGQQIPEGAVFVSPPISTYSNVYLDDLLLKSSNGHRTISKIVPSFSYNTVDNPIFPSAGKRFTAGIDVAGLGGDTAYLKPVLEGVIYIPQTRRLSLGMRGQVQYVRPLGNTQVLPIFERLFMGGEYSVRGFDIRSIGPRDPNSGLVIGGNKSVLFNAEYLIQVAGPVRLVLFYDAGQVWLREDPFKFSNFKTSTGAEIRFFMPVLNVPFRLIFAMNPQRDGVYNNQYQLTKRFTFRFAVGSTF